MKKVVVVGGGASGMMAAISASKNGAETYLIERNEKLGKKLFITGKGRCNVTNACDIDTFFENICRNKKFLYSSYYSFDNEALMNFLIENGCKLCIQRGKRVFPKSERSIDVIRAFEKALKNLNVHIVLNKRVVHLDIDENFICKGILEPNIKSDAVIVSTGGLSYPSTGSTGDGIKFAKDIKILKISECRPSLVPLEVKEDFISSMQGLSLKNIRLSIYDLNDKLIFSDFGELLFTHFGVSGPLILSASALIGDRLYHKEKLKAKIDLKPALNIKQLDLRILRDFSECKNKKLVNSLNKLLPQRMIEVIIELVGLTKDKIVNEITKEKRKKLVDVIKGMEFTIISLRGYNEAVITAGGISIDDINPKTMECKKIKNLYFAGEIIDVDALTGGFNLQVAFSTGYVAGKSAASII